MSGLSFGLVDNDLVDSDVAIRESSEQKIATLVPGETGASNGFCHLFLVGVELLCFQVRHEFLLEEIPDFDAFLGSENQPELLGCEEQAVDDTSSVSLTKEFTLNQIPDHGLTIFTS